MLIALTAAVSACVVLTVLNLVLLFAVIRKLRDQPAGPKPFTVLSPGTGVTAFQATTADGATITEKSLTSTVVAFVSPSCPPCRELVASLPDAGDPLLLVVSGDITDEITEAVEERDHVRVVADPDSTVINRAFGGVDGFPTVARVTGGVVTASGTKLADVLEPVGR